MWTFVQLRRLMDSNRELARKIDALERKYDEQFTVVFEAIKQLIAEDDARKAQPRRRIGFWTTDESGPRSWQSSLPRRRPTARRHAADRDVHACTGGSTEVRDAPRQVPRP